MVSKSFAAALGMLSLAWIAVPSAAIAAGPATPAGLGSSTVSPATDVHWRSYRHKHCYWHRHHPGGKKHRHCRWHRGGRGGIIIIL